MTVSFFEVGENEPHIVTVEDMQAPAVGDEVWLNTLPSAEANLAPHLRGHLRLVVVRRSFSILIADFYKPTTHAEILLRVEPSDPA